MNKIAMSQAATGLLRALIGRVRVSRDRILLTAVQSTDWRSLTFTGERHQFHLRVPGADAGEIVDRMCTNLADAEFSIAGHIVADIAIAATPEKQPDGSIRLTIEDLTVGAD
jgi:hypothetical protein